MQDIHSQAKNSLRKTIFLSNDKDQKVIAFFHNIPSDILALIKICMLAQNPKSSAKIDKK